MTKTTPNSINVIPLLSIRFKNMISSLDNSIVLNAFVNNIFRDLFSL
jgi:hypothetical protein